MKTAVHAPLALTPRRPAAADVDTDFRPAVYLAFGRAMHAFCRIWFRYRMRRMDRVPRGPALLVGNHSGIGVADVLCMLGAWRARHGLERRGVGLMHDLFVAMPVVGWIARSFGAVAAKPELARQAFDRGYDVLVFPGGDLDACRPLHMPRDVRFGPRRGYVRLALERGVPVVPVATIGSHWTYLVLPGGAWLARVFGAKRAARVVSWPVTVGAVVLVAVIALAAASVVSPWWILAAVVAAIVPSPFRVTSEVLPPIDVCAATAHIADPAERVESAHRLVHGALQEAVSGMRHGGPPGIAD
jgi:1-acyl-sn-glycerol-3-phosphate acyltransferase